MHSLAKGVRKLKRKKGQKAGCGTVLLAAGEKGEIQTWYV